MRMGLRSMETVETEKLHYTRRTMYRLFLRRRTTVEGGAVDVLGALDVYITADVC